jgi:hypothetical protein
MVSIVPWSWLFVFWLCASAADAKAPIANKEAPLSSAKRREFAVRPIPDLELFKVQFSLSVLSVSPTTYLSDYCFCAHD